MQTMLELLFTIVLMAYLTSWLSRFIDHSMETGQILHGYYKWLLKFARVEWDKDDNAVFYRWYFNPLGGCIVCMNFWVGVPVFLTICAMYGFTWYMAVLFWLFQAISFSFVKRGI